MRAVAGRGRAGTAALEFAVVMPLLLLLLVGIMDWGMAIDARIQLQTATRAGAQIALRNPNDSDAIRNAVTAAATGASNLDVSSTGVWCECNGGSASCTGSCDGGLQRFLRVGATRSYTPITPAGPTRIAANVTIRLQ